MGKQSGIRSSMKIALAASAALVSFAGQAMAQGSLADAGRQGNLQVRRMQMGQSTFYVPQTDEPIQGIIAWGNGTGGNAQTYSGLLTAVASKGILVAAANTANSGQGREVNAALTTAKQMFADRLSPDVKVCISGHSQGGGGSIRNANLVNADCIIAVQPDTVFTVQIDNGPADPSIPAISITSTGDTLAPLNTNRRNVEQNVRGPLVEVQTEGESHFAPTNGTGDGVGVVMRAAAAAFLLKGPEGDAARALFFGPNAGINANTPDVAQVIRNDGAEQALSR